MKGTVVEIENEFAALLQKDGTFVKTRNNNLKIGDVVNMKEATINKKRKFSTIAAAVAMFVMLVGGGQ